MSPPNDTWVCGAVGITRAATLRTISRPNRGDMRSKTQPAPEGAGCPHSPYANSRAGIEHRDGAAVLRPAGDVVAYRDRPFLAVGDRAHAADLDAARGKVVAHRLGATGPERDVVFAGAALVGVALDQEGVARIGAQPLRLLLERGHRLRSQFSRIVLEEDAVADIDHEVLLAAGGRLGGAGQRGARIGIVPGASPDRQRH